MPLTRALFLLLILIVLVHGPLGAVQATDGEEDPPPPPEAAADDQESSESAEDDEPDPCAPTVDLGDAWVDALNRRVYRSVCGSARWFDSFFGNRRAFAEARSTYGWLSTQLLWSEYDSFEERLRFRAKVDLPNLDQRFKLLVGRLSDEEEVKEAHVDGEGELPSTFRNADDEEWLVGLGYSPVSTSRSRVDYSVGIKTRWPPEPYAKARYRYLVLLDDNRLLRLRQTFFWREREGFGLTSSIDYDLRFKPNLMLRWASTGTVSESADGIDFWSSLTFYEGLGPGRGLAYRLWLEGETDGEIPVDRFGLRVTYRQSVFRDWLFGEIATGVSWPRHHHWEARKPSWGVGIGVEMQFGTRP